ncbi:MAG: hypothetical protein N5P05_002903 [Chroococcopsis gigantea SAG 12.99]|nr:hypothetical protein [Chroococcopsis gigantea SAG 12.99]
MINAKNIPTLGRINSGLISVQNLIATNDTAIVDDNMALVLAPLDLLGNDSGAGLSITGLINPVNGSVAFDANGKIIFNPANTFSGSRNTASFQYTVKDQDGITATATVFITVNSTNKAPVAVNNTATTDQNKPVTIAIASLLANDNDPDGNLISLLSVTKGTNGQVNLDGTGNIIFTPTANYTGNANFRYTIQDTRGATSTANVIVTVRPLPVATNDVVQALSEMPTTILASSLLQNDRDPGNNKFSLIGVSNPLNGNVIINKYGNVVFTPNDDYAGAAGFTYTIQNALGQSTTAQVTVNLNQPPKINMGTNLNGISDWSTQIPFIDTFKSSRPWFQDSSYTKITTNLDSNGWLTPLAMPVGPSSSYPSTILFADKTNADPNNASNASYVVLYDGQGTINYKLSAKKNASLSTPGRDVINVNLSTGGGIFLQIASTDPNKTSDYLRNIRIIPAQYESTYTNLYNGQTFNPSTAQIFNPVFTSRIAPFQTVRFMDWMRTNNSNQVRWSDRPTLGQAQWTTGNGTPVEVMVALANQNNLNPWFNMPHMADDDYVRNFAQYVKNNLAPNKKIYIEYSNEAWNPGFSQTPWVNAQARAAGINGNQWFALRSAQVSKIWKDVFGAQSDQIVGVLGAQASNLGPTSTAIKYLKNTGNFSAINAVAIAPYFGGYLGDPRYASQVQNLTLDDLFDELTQGGVIKNSTGGAAVAGGALQLSYSNMQNYATLASQNNLQLLAYEGGQHLVGYQGAENNNAITNLFIGANRDARMGQLYQQYLTRWNQLGGGLFMNFSDVSSPSKWGSWGAMENLNDTTNPKYSALMQMVSPK